jgi:hypothetical protein
MNALTDQPEKDLVWQITPYVNLLRYKPSQVYFARFRVKGKLIRRSLPAVCQMSQQRNLNRLKRSIFRELMRDLIRDRFGMALRNDVSDELNKQQQAWRRLLRVRRAEVLSLGHCAVFF